jgi:hypothetical protein
MKSEMSGRAFSKLDNPSHEGKTNTWLTPLPLIRELGEFDLDPCAYPGHATAKRLIVLPEDGLSAEWHGRVWLNPPYGREIGKWLKKLQDHGNGIALVFGRTDTAWFHELDPDLIFFIQGRIKFLKPDFTEDTNAGHGSILLAFGRHNAGSILKSSLKGKWK